MPSLNEVRDHKDALSYRIHQIWTEAGPELDFTKVRAVDGTTAEKIEKYHALERELTDVGAEFDRLNLIQTQLKAHESRYQQDSQAVNSPPFDSNWAGNALDLPKRGEFSIRKALADSPEFKAFKEGRAATAKIDIPTDYKTLITLTTVSPQNTRIAPVNMRLEDRTVMDMIGESNVNTATVEWYEETTVTNAAAETTEGSAKAEAALAWTLRSTPIATIATWIPATVQTLDDNDWLESQIRNRLLFMIQRREEQQILAGDGTAPNISGILDNGSLQTQALGADNVPTAVFKAMQKIRGAGGSGFLEPDGIVMHPNDVSGFYTLQATTGEFIMQALLQQSPDIRLWGLPIRQTTAMTENTALVGAFAQSAEVLRRQGVTIAVSTEHSTYFTENKVAIRAESRLGLAVQIPAGFCTVTGI